MSEHGDKYEIFVSYSHKDADVVKPIVQLQRATGSAVFRDSENIPAGKKWRAAIEAAIRGCRLVWVFWCAHASKSKEVRAEYEMGIGLDKDVVPVLMDRTPLPSALSEFQWVDMGPSLGSHEEEREITEPIPPPDGGFSKTQGYSSWEPFRPGGGGWTIRGHELVKTVRELRSPTPAEFNKASDQLASWLRSYQARG